MEPGKLVITPHPVTLEGQEQRLCDLRPGESLATFLGRHIALDEGGWQVAIGGTTIPAEHWGRIYPKDGQVIEVRGVVKRTALSIVAFAALTYFTFGAGTYGGIGAIAGGGFGGAVAAGAVFSAGAAIGGKVIR